MPDSVWQRIGEYRFYRHIPTEAEAIRQLIQAGLDSGPTVKAIIGIMTRQHTIIPGQFDACNRDSFKIVDLLSQEISRHNPTLSPNKAQDIANQIFTRAKECTHDLISVISLLNLDWRWFAE